MRHTCTSDNGLLDPDMPAQEMRLHMGEMGAQEMRTARAAIRWANTHATAPAAEITTARSDGKLMGSALQCFATARELTPRR